MNDEWWMMNLGSKNAVWLKHYFVLTIKEADVAAVSLILSSGNNSKWMLNDEWKKDECFMIETFIAFTIKKADVVAIG